MGTQATKAVSSITQRVEGRLLVAFNLLLTMVRPPSTKHVKLLPLLQASHLATRIVLTATFVAVFLLFLLLCVSFFVLGNHQVGVRLLIAFGVLGYLVVTEWLVRVDRQRAAARLLIIFYLGVSTVVLATWGLGTPMGILSLGFVILLAGIMLGARAILPYTIAVVAILVAIQCMDILGVITPNSSVLSTPSNFGDVASYAVIFAVFALISWVSGNQTEQSLKRALEAEAALQKEKDSLADRLEERTLQLREVQLAEMNQLYRFAELGQLSTATMHELANHLNVLAIDIDDIQQRSHSSNAVTHARESIAYLDAMIADVRKRLREENILQELDVAQLVTDTIPLFSSLTQRHHVVLEYIPPTSKRSVKVVGDPLRLAQVLKVLVTNAVEAYNDSSLAKSERRVVVTVTRLESHVQISICDWGSGISPKRRSTVFEPFRSTKRDGMGVGLFIAKKMVETHFKGSLILSDRTECTEFIVEIPLTVVKKERR